jgi:heparan-alpha-glucosaminide N-acetyltransferase
MNPIALSVSAAHEAEAAAPKAPERLVSLDAYRGLAMLLMASGLLALPEVAAHFPDSRFWQAVGFHWEHVAWQGCSLHDLIQPSFTFMVGVALPFSLAGRAARGQSTAQQWIHVLWRSLLLVLLGVALRSIGRPMTYWTFEDTLSQIGLGYPFLFAIAAWGWRAPWIALGVVLVGYWTAFAVYPLPPADFDWQTVAGKAWYSGFQAHWNQNSNAAWAFDRWFLNLFPRETPFTGNDGGYSTLSFIPTLGTMLLGLIAGRWLLDAPPEEGAEFHEPQPLRTAGKLILTGLLLLLAGWALDRLGWCPSVKKIWTPSWTLFSGGWCFLIMAGFYLVADVWKVRGLFFPLTVVGMNSIAMYVLVESLSGFVKETLLTHLGPKPFLLAGEPYAPLYQGLAIILIFWLVLRWMHGRRLFLKI